MRIATWNVNSLRARLAKVLWWLSRAQPDVLLIQETKLTDADAPVATFHDAGYELAHHGQGRWNGVAIASRCGISDVVSNFGEPLHADPSPDIGDDEPLAEARMIAATCEGVRVVCVYAPNGRVVESTFYEAKLAWYQRLTRWLGDAAHPDQELVIGGDFNIAPTDTWWDYRAGNFQRNFGMRIDHLLATRAVAQRVVWTEIDREARKGKPIPSDHAPLVIDLNRPGHPFEAGWAEAEARIAARLKKVAT